MSLPPGASRPRATTRASRSFLVGCVALALAAITAGRAAAADAAAGPAETLFRADNLAAWCIVPFDDEKRSPADRAAMMRRLGIRKYAYDYRAEHVPQFDEEMRAIKAAGIELVGWWFPGGLNDEARLILDVLRRHEIRTCLWVSGGGGPTATPEEQRARVAAEAARIRPIAEAAAAIGCTVGLYNHGGWFGEPENQIEVIRALGLANVGIVYNQHHGHAHVGRWKKLLEVMKPHLYALNLNGMFADGEKTGRKIAPLGQGELDTELLRTIVDSGYRGPFGILNHTQNDAEDRLRDNLAGLQWLARGLDGREAGPRPVPTTWTNPLPAAPAGAAPPAAKDAVPPAAKDAVPPAAKDAVPPAAKDAVPPAAAAHDPAVVAALAADARAAGNAADGARVFTRATLACLSCHKVAEHGGRIGPALSKIGTERTMEQLAESLLWPQHVVAPEYRAVTLVTDDGTVRRGYRHREDATTVALRDPATDAVEEIRRDAIDSLEETGSMMPHGLLATLAARERRDLVRFLADLGRHEQVSAADVSAIVAASHVTKPADFNCPREPLDPAAFADWRLPVNRDRVFDFYAKEARHFRGICPTPPLLPWFAGLDGGQQGHWGNQNDEVWKSDRWNQVRLGSIQCGVLRGFGLTIPRAVCIQLGDGLSAAFDPDTLSFPLVWQGGFVRFSDVRHGFMSGLAAVGTRVETAASPAADGPSAAPDTKGARYEGFVRRGAAVGFLWTRDGTRWLDVPTARDGGFVRVAAPADGHPLAALLRGGGPQWPETIETTVTSGTQVPFAVDRLGLPFDNPWNIPVFCGGHDFLPDGSIALCTMHGDVWTATAAAGDATRLRWRRVASGLHQPLGLVVVDGAIHVLGRDQITRLGDLDGDGEMDDYRCFSRAYQTSAGGHDFICGLERDARGRFITASSNQGLLRIAADGSAVEVLATGLRNPDGVGVLPDGTVTAASSEGDWVPASLVAAVRPPDAGVVPVHFGHGGPRDGRVPAAPLVWLPRGMDNSSGGQAWIPDGALGPLGGQLVHLSFGAGTAFALLRDECGGVMQGAIVPLPVSFRSGAHRARFNPRDGGLYVSGMAGWGTYTPDEGCLERVRFTGRDAQLPVGFHLHDNGVLVKFARPVDAAFATDPGRHFAQCWNYRYSGGYGSAEYSAAHDGLRGHDHLPITAVHPGTDGRSLFLEIPDIRPVSQLHLLVQSAPGVDHDLVITANRLDASYPGAGPRSAPLPPHPLEVDVARALRTKRNPFEKPLPGARAVEVTVGPNLSYSPRLVTARPGEPLAITLVNPDSVPHNLVLCRPGSLARVGAAVNSLVTDPEAAARQYVPDSPDVIAFTDIVPPHSRFTISLRAPAAPGRHPFLCTFPGHWMAMQGELVVENAGGNAGGNAAGQVAAPAAAAK